MTIENSENTVCDFDFDALCEREKELIKIGIAQLDAGLGIPHKTVRENVEKLFDEARRRDAALLKK